MTTEDTLRQRQKELVELRLNQERTEDGRYGRPVSTFFYNLQSTLDDTSRNRPFFFFVENLGLTNDQISEQEMHQRASIVNGIRSIWGERGVYKISYTGGEQEYALVNTFGSSVLTYFGGVIWVGEKRLSPREQRERFRK